jgi:hypothetical protein
MARPKRAKAKARGRISPTEALTIMRTRMAAPRGAMRLTEAVHDWKRPCRLWRDGKLVSRAEVEHLAVQESADDAGQWHASIGDDRWHRVPGEYEFDAEEVWRLLKAPASQEQTEPQQPAKLHHTPPGPSPTHDWPEHAAFEVGRIVERENKWPSAPRMCGWCMDKWRWEPDDSDMRELLRRLKRLRG